MAMATGEAPYLTAMVPAETKEKKAEKAPEETSRELSEIVQTVQQAVCKLFISSYSAICSNKLLYYCFI